MSEGAADFLAASITGDPAWAAASSSPTRRCASSIPPTWSSCGRSDIGEIHHTGLIFGGTFWDLRKALIAQFGEADGRRAHRQALPRRAAPLGQHPDEPDRGARRATTTTANLANGTPHECAIRDAFGRHGLRTATGAIDGAGRRSTTTALRDRRPIIDVTGLSIAAAAISSTRRARRLVPAARRHSRRGQRRRDARPAPNRFFAAAAARAAGARCSTRSRVKFADGSSLHARRQPRRSVLPALSGPHGEAVLHRLRDDDPFARRLDDRHRRHRHRRWRGARRPRARPIRTPRTPARTSSRRCSTATTGRTQRRVGQDAGDRRRPLHRRAPAVPPLARASRTATSIRRRSPRTASAAWIELHREHRRPRAPRTTSTRSGGSRTCRCRAYFTGHKLKVGWDLKSRRRPRVRRLAARRRLHRREPELDLRRRREGRDRAVRQRQRKRRHAEQVPHVLPLPRAATASSTTARSATTARMAARTAARRASRSRRRAAAAARRVVGKARSCSRCCSARS